MYNKKRLDMLEQVSPIPDWPGYHVTNNGVVTGSSGRVLRLNPACNNNVRLYRSKPPGRRDVNPGKLVLEVFVGPCPDGMECCHHDDDTSNNHIDNVYWGTHSQNMVDRERNGTANHPVGEVHGMSALTELDVLEARELRASNPKYWSYRKLGRRYGVSHPNMIYVIRGDTWRHVS